MDIFGAGAFQGVAVAPRLGLFEALADGPLSVREVAEKIKSDEHATGVLLDFLEAFDYVEKVNGRYANTAMTVKWLLRTSPSSLADMVKIWDGGVFEFWRKYLEESVVKGKPPMTIYEWFNQQPDGWMIFSSFEMAIARWIGDQVAARVKLPPNARRLLDVGGGHGLYSIIFCRRYSQLSATVFDQPQPLEIARKTIASENMDERVSVRAGDFWVDDLGADYDIALLFNIVHNFLPGKNTELLRKVASALNPGGLIAIFDQFTGMAPGPTARATVSFFGLTYLVTVGGKTYSFDEVSNWLKVAGFTNPRRVRLFPGLVLGNK